MGTRGLYVIVKENEVKLSQYSQWDNYYEYGGRKFLDFCRNELNKKYKIDEFNKKVDTLENADTDFENKMKKTLQDFNTGKYMLDVNFLFPQFSRDTGVKILNLINDIRPYYYNDKMKYPISIITDTSWIEFIYVINLDKNEVYLMRIAENGLPNLKTCEIVDKLFGDFECFLKYKLGKIPSEKTCDKHYKKTCLTFE